PARVLEALLFRLCLAHRTQIGGAVELRRLRFLGGIVDLDAFIRTLDGSHSVLRSKARFPPVRLQLAGPVALRGSDRSLMRDANRLKRALVPPAGGAGKSIATGGA